MKKPLQQRTNVWIAVIIILHVVGLAGIISETYRPLFTALSPINLLLSAALMLWLQPSYSASVKVWLMLVFLIGFFAEVIGVKTGLLFGEYQYGNVLGLKLLDVPLLIGFNWMMVSLGSYVLIQPARVNKYLKAILATLLCVLLDVFIEPVAIKLGYWHWFVGFPPLQNYIGWFFVALVIQLYPAVFNKHIPKNRVAAALFITQFVFFVTLSLLL